MSGERARVVISADLSLLLVDDRPLAVWDIPARGVALTEEGAWYYAGQYTGDAAAPCPYCGEVYREVEGVETADDEVVCPLCGDEEVQS